MPKIVTTEASQPDVLGRRLEDAGIGEDGHATGVTLPGVRLGTDFAPEGTIVMYFCPMGGVTQRTIQATGRLNGQTAPTVELEGFERFTGFGTGIYNIVGATVHRNGTEKVIATPETELVPALEIARR